MAEMIEISESLFETEVVKSSLPVLVDFWAPWCRPCTMIAPVLKELAEEQISRLKVVKVNVDEHPGLAARFNVRGIPTLILFKGGQVVSSITGAVSKQALLDKVSTYL